MLLPEQTKECEKSTNLAILDNLCSYNKLAGISQTYLILQFCQHYGIIFKILMNGRCVLISCIFMEWCLLISSNFKTLNFIKAEMKLQPESSSTHNFWKQYHNCRDIYQ